MVTVQEKLDAIKALQDYILNSLKLEETTDCCCSYSYARLLTGETFARKFRVSYGFTLDTTKTIEDQTVTSEGETQFEHTCITDGFNDVGVIYNSLKTYPIETTEIRWTTETDFNKGTHNDTQTISDGDGAVRLKEGGVPAYACWHLNESSGTNVPDTSGNNRNGTTVNMEDGDWVVGKLNNCLSFDGTNEYVNFGNIASFERTDAFSVEAWAKLSAKGIIVSRQQWVSPFRGWYVATNPSGWLQFVLTNTWGSNQLSAYQDEVLMNDNAWHHFVVTYDGSSNTVGVTFYVDGQARTTKGSASTLSATIQVAKNAQLCGADAVNELFTGLADEVLIYPEELSSDYALERWNNGNGREWIKDGNYYTPGTYTSNIYDSSYPNKDWDKIFYNLDLPTDTTVIFKVRVSENGIDWGEWSSALANGDDITADGRFVQWKANLTTSDENVTPKIYDTSITYIENKRNVLSP